MRIPRERKEDRVEKVDYKIGGAPYIEGLRIIGNDFTKRLALLSKEASKSNKMLTVGLDVEVDGDASDVMVDITDLPPLRSGYSCLEDDIASYRHASLGMPELGESAIKDSEDRRIMFIDYILSVALCRVEVVEKGSCEVSSYYATRNIKIAAGVTGESESSLNKYKTFLSSKFTDYMYRDLKVLRIGSRKGGFVLNRPESHLIYDTRKKIKVIPVLFINNYVDSLLDRLSESVWEITHITDTGMVESVVTTLNKGIIQKVYSNEEVSRKFKNSGYIEQESKITLPDLETSRYSDTGVREINVTRIVSVEPKKSIDIRYRDVDYEGVLTTILVSLEGMSREDLSEVYKSMRIGHSEIYMEQKRMLHTYINNRYSQEGEVYLKSLHDFMLEKANIFEGYTGKK